MAKTPGSKGLSNPRVIDGVKPIPPAPILPAEVRLQPEGGNPQVTQEPGTQ